MFFWATNIDVSMLGCAKSAVYVCLYEGNQEVQPTSLQHPPSIPISLPLYPPPQSLVFGKVLTHSDRKPVIRWYGWNEE